MSWVLVNASALFFLSSSVGLTGATLKSMTAQEHSMKRDMHLWFFAYLAALTYPFIVRHGFSLVASAFDWGVCYKYRSSFYAR